MLLHLQHGVSRQEHLPFDSIDYRVGSIPTRCSPHPKASEDTSVLRFSPTEPVSNTSYPCRPRARLRGHYKVLSTSTAYRLGSPRTTPPSSRTANRASSSVSTESDRRGQNRTRRGRISARHPSARSRKVFVDSLPDREAQNVSGVSSVSGSQVRGV